LSQDIEPNKKKSQLDAATKHQIFLEATRDDILQAGILRKWAGLRNHGLPKGINPSGIFQYLFLTVWTFSTSHYFIDFIAVQRLLLQKASANAIQSGNEKRRNTVD
jgi:hypothetical protein